MSSTTALGEYLRARRALVRPQDVGLANRGRRRVPGLRREELATLAGISSDYYLRLEQGRDHHPSAQVIDALARSLRLDEDVQIVPSTEAPTGCGEPPVPVISPAVVNGLARLTGKRYRSLPLVSL